MTFEVGDRVAHRLRAQTPYGMAEGTRLARIVSVGRSGIVIEYEHDGKRRVVQPSALHKRVEGDASTVGN